MGCSVDNVNNDGYDTISCYKYNYDYDLSLIEYDYCYYSGYSMDYGIEYKITQCVAVFGNNDDY